MRKILTILLITILSLSFIGCEKKSLESIDLYVSQRISLGKTETARVVFNPSDMKESVVWTSSDEEVLKIDKNGIITPINVGKAIITVTSESNIIKQKEVEVIKKVDGIVLSAENITLEKGHTAKLTAIVEPSDATYPNLKWMNSNESIISFDQETGIITAKDSGKALLTAITDDSSITATCTITVPWSKENAYLSNNIRWGMSIEEFEDILGKDGSKLNREPDVYISFSPKYNDYYSSIVEEYVYYFYKNQLKAYWLKFNKGSCTYNEYLDMKSTLLKKYGNPGSEKYNWKDKTYKENLEKREDAFRYDDYTIRTMWSKSNFDIIMSWDHSESCTVSYSQKSWTSKM